MADFRLGRLKFNWRGSWQTSTAYVIDDIVKLGSNTYVCTENHTSVSSQTDWVATDSSKWSLHTEGVTIRGEWQAATFYQVNDIAKFGANSYICIDAHTSVANTEDWYSTDLPTKWQLYFSGIENKGDWQSGVYYKVNDIIKYGNTQYRVTTGFSTTGFTTSVAADNTIEYLRGFEYEDTWGAGTEYQEGDVVTYGGYSYIATTRNIGSVPSENVGITWNILTTGFTAVGTFSTLTSYKPGDVVTYGGYAYVASNNTTGDLPLDVSKWDLIVKGINWVGIWTSAVTYKLGDAVKRGSNSYISVASTNINQDPETDSIGTYWNSLTEGAETNVLSDTGDILYQAVSGPARLPVGTNGQVLTVNSGGVPNWENNNTTHPVYYVTEEGSDSNDGSNISRSFATIGHAVGIATGPATIYVKAGTYNEILPIIVPEEVSIVGDNIRTTKIRAAAGAANYQILTLNSTPSVVTFGSTIANAAATKVARILDSDYSDSIITIQPLTGGLWDNSDIWPDSPSNIVINSVETRDNNEATMFMLSNKTMLKDLVMEGMTGYVPAGNVKSVTGEISGTILSALNGLEPDLVGTTVTGVGVSAGTQIVNVTSHTTAEVNLPQTVASTTLTFTASPSDINNATKKGVFVALNPSSPITKSPYVSQCSAFSSAGIGAIVDGRVHRQFTDDGPTPSNKSIVFDSFTNIHDNGVGFWVTNNGAAEFVSCFSYYAHISYASTRGGRIRSLAGNSSWGTYGIVSSGYNQSEIYLGGTVEGLVLEYDPETVTGPGFGQGEKIIGSASTAIGYINNVQTSSAALYYSLITAGPDNQGFAQNETITGQSSGTTAVLRNNTDANRGQNGFTIILAGISSDLRDGGSMEFITGLGNGGLENVQITGSEPFTFVIQTVSYRGPTGLGTVYVDRGQLTTGITSHRGNSPIQNWPVTGNSATLSVPVGVGDTTIFVDTISGLVAGGYVLTSKDELMKVESFPTSNSVSVLREQAGAGAANTYSSGDSLTAIGTTSVLTEKTWKDFVGAATSFRVDGTSGIATNNYIKIDNEFMKVTGKVVDPFGITTVILAEEKGNKCFDGQDIKVRYLYSQARLTGHDFLQIGTGGTSNTNWPSVPLVDPIPANEIVEGFPGRVYYVSTDQDGNFRVGRYFRVNQATGSATLNASAFDLSGLTSLRLGSIGAQLGAQINEFSTDPTLGSNSNEKVPTQAAVKGYVDTNVSDLKSNLESRIYFQASSI